MERQTTVFGPSETAPSTAFDMDIESSPTSDDATKWKLFLPAFTYDRGRTDPETSSTDRASLAEYGGDTAACPVAAMKLKKVVEDGTVVSDDEIDETAFDDYIDDLEAKRSEEHTSEIQPLMRISYAD